MCCGGTKAPTCAKNCSIITFVGGGITLLGMLIAVGVFNVRSPDTPPNINGVTLPCPISVLSVQGMFHENVTCYTDLHDDCDRRRLDTITTMNATQHLELQKKKLEGLKQIRLRLADPLAAVRHGAVELLKKTRLPAAKGSAAADKEAAPRRLSESCNVGQTQQHGKLNLGLNHGGCFLCSAGSQYELDELCKATCLADPNVPPQAPPSPRRVADLILLLPAARGSAAHTSTPSPPSTATTSPPSTAASSTKV